MSTVDSFIKDNAVNYRTCKIQEGINKKIEMISIPLPGEKHC